ncbi:MAG: Rpn family recombination-promoting nuclease/putative transposase [Eubacteriales bacterium]|nr:Rpn family recombination-promoting nuclease/putative transposase [Eubacteriales bacterium]
MGKNDIIMSRWLSHKGRFAGLFNGVLFKGAEVIRPGELEEIRGESDILIVDKEGKDKAFKRYRDVVMRWKRGLKFVILACENQGKTHYAMPVRNMLYDSVSYTEQIDQLWKEGWQNGNKVTAEEYLSHFKKDDVIFPVITLVFYYGSKPWDGSLDIHGMFPEELSLSSREILEKYVPNYRINLVDVMRIKDVENFQKDLQLIFEMLKYKNKKNELVGYINGNKEFFQNIGVDTYNAIRVLLNSEKQLKDIPVGGQGKGEIDMCKALDDLYEDAVERGMEKGIEKGEERVIRLIQLLLENGRSNEVGRVVSDRDYMKKLCKEFNLVMENSKQFS